MDGSPWLIAYLVLATAAVVQAVLLVIQAWEHRRYGWSCIASMDEPRETGRALVLAPCKGLDVGLEASLRSLLRQDYPDYEVAFIVESADDPACRVIRRVMAAHPHVATRLVVAGRATDSGQKVHNLRAATASLDPAIRFLTFIDSDANPRPQWLRLAVARLSQPGVAATTGYRWFVPGRPSLAHHLLYSLNCGLMSLLAKRSHYLVWGGSWAISRETFDEIGLHQAWQGTLSDDLVARRVLRAAGRQVRFEPGCVMASPLEQSFRQVFSFIRRQYVITRCYAPGWWWFALAVTSLKNAAWLATIGCLAMAVAGLAPAGWALTVGGVLYVLSAAHGWLVQDLVPAYFPDKQEALRPARRFAIWAAPLAGLFHWLGVLSAAVGRHITWRGIHYRLLPGGRIQNIERTHEICPAIVSPDETDQPQAEASPARKAA